MLSVLASACGGGSDDKSSGNPDKTASSGKVDLRAVCPSTIVVQTSWLPDPGDGPLYYVLGPNPAIDAKKKRVTGALMAQGKDTGVKLQLRSGGPAIGYTQTSAQMYLDPSITLGTPPLDEVIQLSRTQPTLAVMALFEKDPTIIMWDPATHPEFQKISDIGKTNTKVLYFEGDTYMEYLVGSGALKRSQVDGSFDGSPSRFVAERGKVAQSGYATDEPYSFEHEVKAWGKPVKYQLVNDAGYPNYGAVLALRARDKSKLAPCLRKLVPILQQAQVDFLSKPESVIDLTLRLNEVYKAGSEGTRGGYEFNVQQQKALGIVGNGNDTTIGNFDDARVQRLINIDGPIFAAQKKPIKDGLEPADVATNEFVAAIGIR